MKKTHIYLAGLAAGFFLLTSCGSNKTIDKTSTAIDSLNYAVGVNIANEIASYKASKINMSEFERGIKEGLKHSDTVINEFLFGYNVGGWLKSRGIENPDIEMIRAGIADALSKDTSKNSKVSAMQANQIISNYFMSPEEKEQRRKYEEDMKKREEEAAKAFEHNKLAGEEFLAANKTKDGVVELPSGLQYKLLKEGTGAKPTASDVVKVFYRGTTINGVEFDSNIGKEPLEFPLSNVIPGWTEGFQHFNAGSKFMLYIPYNLAYGTSQRSEIIEPYTTLVFEVELLEVVGK